MCVIGLPLPRTGPVFSSDKVLVANAQGAPWQSKTFDMLTPPTAPLNLSWEFVPDRKWSGSFLGSCQDTLLLEQDALGLSGGDAIRTFCRGNDGYYHTSTCQARCCPSRILDNIGGYLQCAGDSSPNSCSCPEAFGWRQDTGAYYASSVVGFVPGLPLSTRRILTYYNGWSTERACYSSCCPGQHVKVVTDSFTCETATGSTPCAAAPCPLPPPSILLDTALDASARNWTRTVACTAVGQDPTTLLPVSVEAQSKVVLAKSQGWVNFTWPMAG